MRHHELVSRRLLCAGLACLSFFGITSHTEARDGQPTVFFAGGHPDDIQLFMGATARGDILNAPLATKVFIVLTAGDAGWYTGRPGTDGTPYWRARRNGHEASIQFLASLAGTRDLLTTTTVTHNGHALERRAFGSKIVMYNMMLPDRVDGYSAPIVLLNSPPNCAPSCPTQTTIDGLHTYTKDDLIATLGSIVRAEAPQSSTIWFNVTEDNAFLNPGDHNDHIGTSRLMQLVQQQVGPQCIGVAKFRTYANSGNEFNGTPVQINMAADVYRDHVATFGILNGSLIKSGFTTWDAAHLAWLGKQYLMTRIPQYSLCNF